MPLALFGIGGGLGLAVNLLVLFLIVVYLALIYWTYLDARRRIEDPVLIACATAASVFPYLGTIVYTILRPPEFLEDREERELELRAAELELRQRIEQSCPHCEYPVERSYLRCPNCERRLRNPCRKCHKPLDPALGDLPVLRDRGPQAAAAGARAAPHRPQRAARSAAQRKARADGTTRREPAPPVAAREERPSSLQPFEPADWRLLPSDSERRVDDPQRLLVPTGAIRARFVYGPAPMATERTLILVKPDAFERALTGEVIARFERKGLRLVALKLMQADEELANTHYAEHADKPFFGELVEFITRGDAGRAGARGTQRREGRAPGDRRD